MLGATVYQYSFIVLVLCVFELFNLIYAINLASMKWTNIKSFPNSDMDEIGRSADFIHRNPLKEDRWDYFHDRNLRHCSALLDLYSKNLRRRDNQKKSNLNEIHKLFLKRQRRSQDDVKIEFLGAVSDKKEIDLDSPGIYNIQKRRVQHTAHGILHINDKKIAETDIIPSKRKPTFPNYKHTRHSRDVLQSSRKSESVHLSDGNTDHTYVKGEKEIRHGTVHRHRHSGHSFRHLDSSINVISEAAEQDASRTEAGYQSKDRQHFDANTNSDFNTNPDHAFPTKNETSPSDRKGFETFIQNVDINFAKGFYPFSLKDASDRHIPNLDDIPIYMQHVYLLLSKEDNTEQSSGQVPTIRAIKLFPDNNSQMPGMSFNLTGLITQQDISRVDLVFENPGCENLPSLLEVMIRVNPGSAQEEVPYEERILISQYLSFYKAEISDYLSSLINSIITLVLRQVGDINKGCFQHPLLVTYKNFVMTQNRQHRSTDLDETTSNSSEIIKKERVLFHEIMALGKPIEYVSNPSCCRRNNWYIDMQVFDFPWYLGPTYIEAHYCSGDCSYPMADPSLNATNYSFIKTMYHEMTNYDFVSILPRATCVPISYLSQSIIFIDNTNSYVIKKLPNMKVKDCGCR